MRIVIVAGYAPSLVNFRAPLLRALVARGHKVMALAPPDEKGGAGAPGVEAALRAMGVELTRFPMQRGGLNPCQDLRTLLALRREFLLLQPDLVLAYTIKPVIYGSLAARWAGAKWAAQGASPLAKAATPATPASPATPAISSKPMMAALITGLGYAFGGIEADACSCAPGWSGRRVLSELVLRLYRKALQNNRVVIFQNPDDRDLFARLKLTGPGQRVAVVAGSGVDLDHFAQAPPVLSGSFADAHTGSPIFLCVARLLWAKGVGVYVEACRLLKQRYPQAICRLLGPLDRVPDAVSEDVVRCWREDRVVEILDPVDDVRPHLAAASVFVLPSFREGTPRSVLEAMAMGRPVVTTDVPGCRQTVEQGVTGLLVPPFEPGALMRAMARFIEEPELIAQMGAAGRRLAEEKFDADLVVRDMLAALGLAGMPTSAAEAAPDHVMGQDPDLGQDKGQVTGDKQTGEHP
ncbi:MAG: glycosyltransferase family 4 protein [Humidesulfovibrio sp.]|nr:glycosyltransferase family 4 protein [Humidesulfovibrio sp.]